MKILLIGSGGREHALAWKLAQSPLAEKIYAAPGNPGIAEFAECVAGISTNAEIVRFAQENGIDLVVVGPEAPLVAGLVDELEAAGIKAFGPKKSAAQLEGSKIFDKNLMKKYGIPTAKFETFDNLDAAKNYIRSEGAPIVIKADGLAAGKGVIVAQNLDEALNAVDEMKNFGAAGDKIVVEEFTDGEEASILAFTDGETIIPMIAAQDHKRLNDGDAGVNTGGMGAYAPAPVVTAKVAELATEKILKPVIAALKAEGITYRGCLYAGLMIVNGEPKVVEFNARFGDPETQVVLPRLQSDLVDVMLAVAEGRPEDVDLAWSDAWAVSVVLASQGYPKAYEKGKVITGIADAEALPGVTVFHAGTKVADGQVLTSGGRVLNVTALSDSFAAARDLAYQAAALIDFEGKFFRTDIGMKAIIGRDNL